MLDSLDSLYGTLIQPLSGNGKLIWLLSTLFFMNSYYRAKFRL